MADYQKIFHGTHKLFDKFSEEFILTGTELTKFGWGFYFTTDVNVSEHYRDYLQVLDITETGVKVEDEEIDPKDSRFDIVIDYAKNHNASDIEDDELVEFLENGDYQVSRGAILQVRAPSEERLLKWDAAQHDQPIDLVDFVRDIYGDDMIEGFYEEIHEHISTYESEDGEIGDLDDLDEVFDEILLNDIDYQLLERMEQTAPGYNWDAFIDSFKEKKIHIDKDGSSAGENLYTSLVHILGSDRVASKALQKAGVPGLSYAANSVGGMSADAEERNLVVWDLTEIKVLKTHQFDIDALITDTELQKSEESNYSPY